MKSLFDNLSYLPHEERDETDLERIKVCRIDEIDFEEYKSLCKIS